MDTFGKRLEALRTRLGMTQDDMALELDVSRVQISKYESDQNFPRLARLIEFCVKTNTSLDWLVLGQQSESALGKRVTDLPEGLRQYVMEALAMAENVAETLPAKLLAPPTTENYLAFSEYLTKLSEEISRKTVT